MTAEVIILNKSAVAMAADSKGTLTIGQVVKTHDTLNKLFTLSKYHPVGIMIYGNVEHIGHPWETIIKLYRDRLRDRSFERLNQYVGDFMYSVHKDYTVSPSLETAFLIVRDFFGTVLRNARNVLESSESAGAPLSDRDAVFSAFEDWQEEVNTAQVLWGFRKIPVSQLEKLYADEVETAYNEVFDGIDVGEIKDQIKACALEALRRAVFSEDFSTGVVISGFGNKQIYPAFKSYMIDGVVAGQLRAHLDSADHISAGTTSIIKPYAQKEMVVRFMEGIDPDYRIYMQETIRGFANSIVDATIDVYGKGRRAEKIKAKSDARDLVNARLKDMFVETRRYRREFFIDPIVSMVQLLTKSDMAHLAESLVNLTSLKRRMSLDQESVGGPIDVAVISKGDGFIWIKRKHYFDPSINQTFIPNYFRSYLNAVGETGHDRYTKA